MLSGAVRARDCQRYIMPLFSRSSFRTPKKPPRRNKSLPNIAGLDDYLNFTAESIKLDAEAHATGETTTQSSLVMKLGEAALSFEDGQWIAGKSEQCLNITNWVVVDVSLL